MELGLTGKVALVTASSKGLGRASAEALAREGARVVLNGRRPDELALAAQEIRRVMAVTGAEVHTVAGDVTDPEDIGRLIKATISRFGQLDILVTNGGGPSPGKFADLGEREWQAGLDSTLWPVIRLIRAALPHLQAAKERGGGRILNIVSTSVKQPIPGLFLSNALRPAVIGLAKSLSVELPSTASSSTTSAPAHSTPTVSSMSTKPAPKIRRTRWNRSPNRPPRPFPCAASATRANWAIQWRFSPRIKPLTSPARPFR